MNARAMKKLPALCLVLAVGMAHAERPPLQGKKLAGETVKILGQLDPLVLSGAGLSSAGPTVYYRSFLNPLQAALDKWPTSFDPEARTWGDYLYCRDALSMLQTIGMGQENGSGNSHYAKRVSEYKRILGKCRSASKLSPEQVQ